MDEQVQYNKCLAPLFLNERNYGRQSIRVLFHNDFPIFFWAISSVGACLSAFSVMGRFRSPTSLIGSIAGLQCTKLVVRWKAVYPRKYPTILLPRCEHSGGKSEVEQAIIGHGIGLITCPLIFCEPTTKMDTFRSAAMYWPKAGISVWKDMYRPDSGMQDQRRNKVSSVVP